MLGARRTLATVERACRPVPGRIGQKAGPIGERKEIGMRFISPRVHGVLDYTVATVLIGAPLVLNFAASSVAAAILSIAAGIGLTAYSLFTNYSAGLRHLIPWRVHLMLDAVAAVALLAAPFLLGFGGVAR